MDIVRDLIIDSFHTNTSRIPNVIDFFLSVIDLRSPLLSELDDLLLSLLRHFLRTWIPTGPIKFSFNAYSNPWWNIWKPQICVHWVPAMITRQQWISVSGNRMEVKLHERPILEHSPVRHRTTLQEPHWICPRTNYFWNMLLISLNAWWTRSGISSIENRNRSSSSSSRSSIRRRNEERMPTWNLSIGHWIERCSLNCRERSIPSEVRDDLNIHGACPFLQIKWSLSMRFIAWRTIDKWSSPIPIRMPNFSVAFAIVWSFWSMRQELDNRSKHLFHTYWHHPSSLILVMILVLDRLGTIVWIVRRQEPSRIRVWSSTLLNGSGRNYTWKRNR